MFKTFFYATSQINKIDIRSTIGFFGESLKLFFYGPTCAITTTAWPLSAHESFTFKIIVCIHRAGEWAPLTSMMVVGSSVSSLHYCETLVCSPTRPFPFWAVAAVLWRGKLCGLWSTLYTRLFTRHCCQATRERASAGWWYWWCCLWWKLDRKLFKSNGHVTIRVEPKDGWCCSLWLKARLKKY